MDELGEGLPNDLFGGDSDERLDGWVEVGDHALRVDGVDHIADFFHQVAIFFLRFLQCFLGMFALFDFILQMNSSIFYQLVKIIVEKSVFHRDGELRRQVIEESYIFEGEDIRRLAVFKIQHGSKLPLAQGGEAGKGLDVMFLDQPVFDKPAIHLCIPHKQQLF